MTFDPQQFAIKKQFGSDWFSIRPAKTSDRELVWEGYQNVSKEFFKHITEITRPMIEFWYPTDREINFEQALPFNVMLLDEKKEEKAFAGNITLGFTKINRLCHTTTMGMGVLPEFQKRGIGSFLTELSVKVAKAKPGIIRLQLEVCATNPARKIYTKYGYKEEGVQKGKWLYPDGTLDDLIVMGIIFPEKRDLLKKKEEK